MNQTTEETWHQLQTEEVVQLLDVELKAGLSSDEVKKRQIQFGPNRLTARRKDSPFKRFTVQFHQPLVYILLVASIVTLLLQEWVDATVILAVVFINAVIGFLQEAKAERAIEALSEMIVTEATVRRDGKKKDVSSVDLVPGDVVLLQSGDKMPADLRFYRVKDLQVDESALTGESVPVEKHAGVLALDTILAERKNLGFAGTMVTYGQAEGVVWAIGNQTETGRIARLISGAISLSTPLTRKIAHFSKILLWIILGLAGVTFTVGVVRGGQIVEMFMAAVALAVGAIPEGLPAAVTITLAVGVARMAKRQAIIRKLPAVETLGSTTVICSDKTGTLTENQMTVQQILAGGNLFDVTGSGYDPAGEIRLAGNKANASKCPALFECLKNGLLCNDSQLVQEEGRYQVEGDPTEAAFWVTAQKAGLNEAQMTGQYARLDSVPFESQHQYMATLHGDSSGTRNIIYLKGSVEQILERCSNELRNDGSTGDLDLDQIRQISEDMASRGLRVLAFARRETSQEQQTLQHSDVAGDLTFLGLQAMIDPPREEAIEAVSRCQRAGIQVKMITGDHLLTAKAVAKQLGIRGSEGEGEELRAINGQQLAQIPDAQLPEVAFQTSVFARVAPEQKLRLVKALQSRGEIVAMTGDGVNDAPALKSADIGVAMGISGTEVAKGACDMILTDDNFASIEAAVEEGRSVFDNLRKFIVWTLPTNAGEAVIILAAIFVGTALPIQPVQLLWINMVTAVFLGLMLVFEPKERGLMQRPPRDPKTPLLTLPLGVRTGLVALIMAAGAFGLFLWERRVRGAELAEAQTVVINVIVTVEMFYLLNCRSLLRSMWSMGIFSNPWIFVGIGCMITLQLLQTYVPMLNRLFHTAPIGPKAWVMILGVGILTYSLIGLEKWVRGRKTAA